MYQQKPSSSSEMWYDMTHGWVISAQDNLIMFFILKGGQFPWGQFPPCSQFSLFLNILFDVSPSLCVQNSPPYLHHQHHLPMDIFHRISRGCLISLSLGFMSIPIICKPACLVLWTCIGSSPSFGPESTVF